MYKSQTGSRLCDDYLDSYVRLKSLTFNRFHHSTTVARFLIPIGSYTILGLEARRTRLSSVLSSMKVISSSLSGTFVLLPSSIWLRFCPSLPHLQSQGKLSKPSAAVLGLNKTGTKVPKNAMNSNNEEAIVTASRVAQFPFVILISGIRVLLWSAS